MRLVDSDIVISKPFLQGCGMICEEAILAKGLRVTCSDVALLYLEEAVATAAFLSLC